MRDVSPRSSTADQEAETSVEFLECVPQVKHRAILLSCYAARLRVSEVVRLKPGDVDTRRMVIRIEQGKGGRDRYVMLLSRLVNALEKWREFEKPKQWLFPGNRSENPITRHAVEKACREAHRRSGICKPITPHGLRHYAGSPTIPGTGKVV
jgi:integrase/recombinase XerD